MTKLFKSAELKRILWTGLLLVLFLVVAAISQFVYNSLDNGASRFKSKFACENDKLVKSRGYVYIHGLGDDGPGPINSIINLTRGDTKVAGFLDFDYNEKLALNEIGADFVSKFNTFATRGFDEIVVFGISAGGIVASYSAHQLISDGIIEIHTTAAPLNGYKLGIFSQRVAKDFKGLIRDIGLGLEPYLMPRNNVRIYHHKTVEDEFLRFWCGSYAIFCNPRAIQDNNVPGSKEFYYPEDSHRSIVATVAKKIIACRDEI
ncbi:MAG: hypothetical protein Q8O87_01005 [bacterium]|nr:hypothetical protein [bacterium]